MKTFHVLFIENGREEEAEELHEKEKQVNELMETKSQYGPANLSF